MTSQNSTHRCAASIMYSVAEASGQVKAAGVEGRWSMALLIASSVFPDALPSASTGWFDLNQSRSGIEPSQCGAIAQYDPAGGRELDGGCAFQVPKRTRDGLDRQTQIIGNVLPRHRQLDGSADRHALGHLQEKRGHALLGVLDQQQDMILHLTQFGAGQSPELAGDVVIARCERNERTALDDQQLAFADRLRGKGVLRIRLKSESITREIETAHLPTAIGKHLIGSHGAYLNLVEVLGRLTFAVDLDVAPKGHRRTHEVDHSLQLMSLGLSLGLRLHPVLD